VIVFKLGDAAAPAPAGAEPAGADPAEGATLVGSAAEEAGLTATEVRRRAAAEAARQRRQELEEKPRHKRLKTAAKLLVALLLVAVIAFGAWYGNRQVWFLGTDDAGRVALYRGLPYELPFGITLYDQRYASPIQTAGLPAKRQDAVTGHSLRSRNDAVDLIEDIQRSQGVP
jgi:PPM family protein phosphatase